MKDDQEAKEFKAPSDKGRIYVYRNEALGSAIKVSVSVDGKMLGQTAPNTYFVADVEPGQHQVSCFAESNSQVNIKVDRGQSAYVWQEMKMGLMSAGCAMHEVRTADGQKGVLECKRAQGL